MTDLQDLYQEIIIDHSKMPRNFGTLVDAQYVHTGHNPLCGDKVTVAIKMCEPCIEQILFTGEGCAISLASASLMTEFVKGKSMKEIQDMFADFHGMVTTGQYNGDMAAKLGDLMVFAQLRDFPMRIKCATLAWHTLRAVLALPAGAS